MFCAGAPDRVGSNLFTCVTIQDKTECQGFSSMMIRCQVYTMLIGDHVVDLSSSILEQHIFRRVLDIYPCHNSQKA